MSDLISRQKAKDAIDMALDHIDHVPSWVYDKLLNALNKVPSVQPTHPTPSNTLGALDCISRQAAIDALNEYFARIGKLKRRGLTKGEKAISLDTVGVIKTMPSAQPETNCSEFPNNSDTISRQAAIDALHMHLMYRMGTDSNKKRLDDWINGVPSVQPERTCVNCGRTVNNGGWYADGGTRCPIEEHYALPKDGYCHLWEKRNVTDDDYPERREE